MPAAFKGHKAAIGEGISIMAVVVVWLEDPAPVAIDHNMISPVVALKVGRCSQQGIGPIQQVPIATAVDAQLGLFQFGCQRIQERRDQKQFCLRGIAGAHGMGFGVVQEPPIVRMLPRRQKRVSDGQGHIIGVLSVRGNGVGPIEFILVDIKGNG